MINEINCQFPLNCLGYGIAGSYISYELSKLTKVNLFPIGRVEFTNSKFKELEFSLNNAVSANFSKPTIKLWHQGQLLDRVGNGHYFGWPIFELNKFTEQELVSLRCPQELIVCSSWGKSIIKKYFPNKKIHIIPLGIDSEIFKPNARKEDKVYKFFTCGKTEIRKGHDILFECFNKAFEITDNVELHIMWHNPFFSQEENEKWTKLYKNSKLGLKIFFHPRVSTHNEVASFINSCDCGIFLSRAEGFNIEALESLACGKTNIITNYSGHTEFCNNQNSRLITIDKLEPAHDGKWFHGQGEWAFLGENQKNQIIEQMRLSFKERKFNDEGIKTALHFSWKNAAQKLYDAINS